MVLRSGANKASIKNQLGHGGSGNFRVDWSSVQISCINSRIRIAMMSLLSHRVAPFLVGLSLATVALPGLAADQKTALGTFKDWSAIVADENGRKVCYMLSEPKKALPGGKSRGRIYILVTHRPTEKSFDVVSVAAGYAYKKDSEVTLEIGKKTFKLFTKDDQAWARDEKTDKEIVAAVRSGTSMTVKGQSARGTKTTDTYSLNGVGGAYTAINEACGVKNK
ncbi:hypothetical protein CCP2SC5_10024 [Azospirillaceae bacterium]